jgi:hypothetical protein
MSEEANTGNSRRASDCPEWTQEPIRLFMEKFKKLDELVIHMQYMRESIDKLIEKDEQVAQIALQQTKHEAWIRAVAAVALICLPVMGWWLLELHQDVKKLRNDVTVLEQKK